MMYFKIIGKQQEVGVMNFGTNVINKYINRRDPRVEPWGTPESTDKYEGNIPNIRTEKFLADK
jgi:hypothetical protein